MSPRSLRSRLDRLEAQLPKPGPPGEISDEEIKALSDDELEAFIAEVQNELRSRNLSGPDDSAKEQAPGEAKPA
jgi:uncharacterized small protein (DUF1192 family)